MHWAKTHPRARFELTVSGVPDARIYEFGGALDATTFDIRGTYGDPDLIQAVARFRDVPPEWVFPAPGASAANLIALASVANRGDRVLVESPVYEPLPLAMNLLGLCPMSFDRRPEARFRPDLDAIERGLAEGAKAVMLTDLHNPSGLACPDNVLGQVAALAARHGAHLIVDEVYLDYARLNVDGWRRRPVATTLGEHVVTTDSLTKVYGLGGLRAGWIIAHRPVLQRAEQVIDVLHVVNPVVSARIATQALENIHALGERCRRLYDAAYPEFLSWLNSHSDLVAYGNDGAMFSWVGLPDGVAADALVELLATRYETNIVSGTFFGCRDHVRIGFGSDAAMLREGLSRVSQALQDLRSQA